MKKAHMELDDNIHNLIKLDNILKGKLPDDAYFSAHFHLYGEGVMFTNVVRIDGKFVIDDIYRDYLYSSLKLAKTDKQKYKLNDKLKQLTGVS